MERAPGTQGMTPSRAALIVGFALLNPVPYAEFSIYPKLVVAGDIQQTITNISTHQGLFVAAIFCYLINFVEDIVIAWALYFLLAPVNRAVSALAALFRLVYTAVALFGTFNLVTVYRMLSTPEYLKSFGAGQFDAQVNLLLHQFRYDYAFAIGAIFSIHLILAGALIVRSRYIPSWLGVLLILDGLAWMVSNFQPYLYPKANLGPISILYLGELVFMIWCLIRGWKIPETVDASAIRPATA